MSKKQFLSLVPVCTKPMTPQMIEELMKPKARVILASVLRFNVRNNFPVLNSPAFEADVQETVLLKDTLELTVNIDDHRDQAKSGEYVLTFDLNTGICVAPDELSS